MVEAEERKMNERKQATGEKEEQDKKKGKHVKKHHESKELSGGEPRGPSSS